MTKQSTRAKLRALANARIGQKRTTGQFKRTVAAVEKRGGSHEQGVHIAATRYWKEVKKHQGNS